MKYVVIELQKLPDDTVANIVTAHDTLSDAESRYHGILSAAAVSGLPCHSAIIVSEEGFPVEHKAFKSVQ